MAKNSEFKWLNETGSDRFNIADKTAIKTGLEKKIGKFLVEVQDNVRRYKLIGTGALASNKGIKVNTIDKGPITEVEFYMIKYGMFQNLGVKGIKSFRNAPASPFKFKKWGMSDEGRNNIKQSILQGKLKTRNVKYEKQGLETKTNKSKDPIDAQVDDIVYKIKRFGIKAKPFYTEAFEKYFGKFDEEMIKYIKKQIVYKLQEK